MGIEETLPGITFSVKQITKLKAIGDKKRVLVELSALVEDEELWESVVEKLDGLRIYSSHTFKDEILSALRETLQEVEVKQGNAETQVSYLENELRVAHAQVDYYKKLFDGLEAALVGFPQAGS